MIKCLRGADLMLSVHTESVQFVRLLSWKHISRALKVTTRLSDRSPFMVLSARATEIKTGCQAVSCKKSLRRKENKR